MTTLTHAFKHRCHDLSALLEGCEKLSTFCSRLEKQADFAPDRYDPNTYKGDGFEMFVEALLKLFPVMWVGQYQPISKGVQDYGVDGFGIAMNGLPATVQCKFRSDSRQLLVERDLAQFAFQSQNRYDVPITSTTSMWVITTAKDLHYFTKDEMFMKKVQCIGYDQLRTLVDNNVLFWNEFRRLAFDK
jgi:hypothetical protein